MFKRLFKKFLGGGAPSRHTQLSPEEWNAQVMPHRDRLAEGLALAIEAAQEPVVNTILRHAHIVSVVEESEQAATTNLSFPKLNGYARQVLCLTWDWIDNQSPGDMADFITAHVRQLIADGDLPGTLEGIVVE